MIHCRDIMRLQQIDALTIKASFDRCQKTRLISGNLINVDENKRIISLTMICCRKIIIIHLHQIATKRTLGQDGNVGASPRPLCVIFLE